RTRAGAGCAARWQVHGRSYACLHAPRGTDILPAEMGCCALRRRWCLALTCYLAPYEACGVKYRFAVKWKLQLVSVDWIHESVAATRRGLLTCLVPATR